MAEQVTQEPIVPQNMDGTGCISRQQQMGATRPTLKRIYS